VHQYLLRYARGVDFSEVVAVLEDWLGEPVAVTVQGAPEASTNTGTSLRGELRKGSRQWSLISPRSGSRCFFDVGNSGRLTLLEGDYLTGELDPSFDALMLEFDGLQINIARVSKGATSRA
jgi:hypothetical protein